MVFAVNEERLNREKLTGRFPIKSIYLALEMGQIKPEDVNYIIIGTRITPIIKLMVRLSPNPFYNFIHDICYLFMYYKMEKGMGVGVNSHFVRNVLKNFNKV